MFEKINAETGKYGDGGEYTVQTGFGWTNGAVIDMLVNIDVAYSNAKSDNLIGFLFIDFICLLLLIEN